MTLNDLVLIFLSFAVIGYSIQLEILNVDVVYDRIPNSVLTLGISYINQAELVQSSGFSKLCLTIDGRACKCYDDYLTQDVILSTECILRRSHWFAVVIIPSPTNNQGGSAVRTIHQFLVYSRLLTLVNGIYSGV